jgi:hypothetical protein
LSNVKDPISLSFDPDSNVNDVNDPAPLFAPLSGDWQKRSQEELSATRELKVISVHHILRMFPLQSFEGLTRSRRPMATERNSQKNIVHQETERSSEYKWISVKHIQKTLGIQFECVVIPIQMLRRKVTHSQKRFRAENLNRCKNTDGAEGNARINGSNSN